MNISVKIIEKTAVEMWAQNNKTWDTEVTWRHTSTMLIGISSLITQTKYSPKNDHDECYKLVAFLCDIALVRQDLAID